MKRNQQKKKAAWKAAEPESACQICFNSDWEADRVGVKVEFVVERDYDSAGRYRGWLCGPCKVNVDRFEAGKVCFAFEGISLYLRRNG